MKNQVINMLKISEKESDYEQENTGNYTKWWTIIGVGIGVFIFGLDLYVINLALPIMVESLHTSFATIQWVILSYLVSVSVCVLSAAKLGDIWSKKQLYIMGMLIFSISSLFCGIAPNIDYLIAFRALQGLGAAFISGLDTAIIVEVFPPQERGLGLGIRAGLIGLGIMLGPTIGGMLIAWGGWHLIFLINVPIGIIGTLIVARFVPPSIVSDIPQKFDFIGTLTLTITLICFSLSITLFQNNHVDFYIPIILLILSGIGLLSFIGVESYILDPMLDFKIFHNLEFSLGLIMRFLGNFIIAGIILILPFFLELVKKYPSEKAGILMAIPPLIIVITAPIAGILSDRFGTKIISFIGLILMAIACLLLSTFNTELTIFDYIIKILPYGLGVGMFQSPNNSGVMGAAPKDQLGLASGLLALSRILGQMVGVPMVAALFFFMTTAHTNFAANIDINNAPIESLVFATQITFRIVAIVLITLTMLATLFWWKAPNKIAVDGRN